MKTELSLKFEFSAFHSLSVREEPHKHLWKVEVRIQGSPIGGMLVNMTEVRENIEVLLSQLESSYLNQNPTLPKEVQTSPTCETLGSYFYFVIGDMLQHNFFPRNPSLCLSSVEVTICEENGFEWGSAKLYSTLNDPEN
ncbi:MAG: 6-carboxytetrahydropterin synthase [Chloroherpetonaceae bacterium]|nr:6-carboxytetrahydropterin synthase [Chloroherpetonaceae bacterium]